MKKGFTLVELLAVIVILAIILVIAVPQIMDTINQSKKSSLESSTKLVASTLETDYQSSLTVGSTFNTSGSCMSYVDSDEYNACTYTISDSGEASVILTGKTGGKFSGLKAIGTKITAIASSTDLPTIKASLSEYTWAEIKQLSDALVSNAITTEQLSIIYNITIGSVKNATINNETHQFRIVGFKHDTDANGNTLGMTFEQVDLMNNIYLMYSYSNVSGSDSWDDSELKATINSFTIETSLNSVITAAKKPCVTSIADATLTYVTSKLWIMSETEISGKQDVTRGKTKEGTQYAYYVTNSADSDRIKKKGDVIKTYWLRSAIGWTNPFSRFASISENGYIGSSDSPYSNHYVSICFSV